MKKATKTVLMLLNGNINYDSRVKKLLHSLDKIGLYKTTLISNHNFAKQAHLHNTRIISIYGEEAATHTTKNNSFLLGLIRKIAIYLLITPVRWFKFAAWRKKAKRIIQKEELSFDIIHCNDFITLPLGIWLKKKLIAS
jgi:hypothetical protein